jgi:ribonuclease P protein component
VNLGLSRKQRLRKTYEFLQVKSNGVSIRQAPFWIQAHENFSGPSKLGVIATKRLGNAVARNQAKRLIRELFRKHKHSLPFTMHLVVLPRSSIFQTPFTNLETLFIDALNKASNRL